MRHLVIITAAAMSIFIGSGCFKIENGKVINRCGLYQVITNSKLVMMVDKGPNEIITKLAGNPRNRMDIESLQALSGKVNLSENNKVIVYSSPSSTITASTYFLNREPVPYGIRTYGISTMIMGN